MQPSRNQIKQFKAVGKQQKEMSRGSQLLFLQYYHKFFKNDCSHYIYCYSNHPAAFLPRQSSIPSQLILLSANNMLNYHNRYKQTPVSLSFLDLKPKAPSTSRNIFVQPSSRNPENESVKLPALNNSMRRSSSFSTADRNTKFRLQSLEEKLEELYASVHATRREAQQTFQNIRCLTEGLAGTALSQTRDDLRKQVKGFERLVLNTKAADQQRTQTIKQDCQNLWQQTESLRQTLFELRMRTDQLEETMGFQKQNK